MAPYQRNIITGLVVAFAMGTLIWMFMAFSGSAMSIFKPPSIKVKFLSSRADGLSDGSPVLYRGVEVGTVDAVTRLSDKLTILIQGHIDNHPPLPANLRGIINRQSALGAAAEIDLDDDGSPIGELAPNAEIHIQYAGNSLLPPEFADLMREVQKQELVKNLNLTVLALNRRIETAGQVMDSVQKVIGDGGVQADLRTTIANLKSVSERANRIGTDLEGLTTDAKVTMTDLRATVADVHTTVTRTNENVDRLSKQVGEDLDRLGNVFHQLEDTTAKINSGKGTAGLLINDPKLYDELAGTAKELNVVSKSLERLVDQWEHEGVSLKLK